VTDLSAVETEKVLSLEEGHFADLKAVDVSPAKITRTLAAFSNAEGGEAYIGIDEDKQKGTRTWRGFVTVEAANGHIQAFEQLFPLGSDYSYDFLRSPLGDGLVLKVEVRKTREIKRASNDKVYVRRGAMNLPLVSGEDLSRLERNKGLSSYETETLNADPEFITNSETIIEFILGVVPNAEPDEWLRKQQLLIGGKPTVAGTVLFADEPQALLPKRCGIKLYRYKTKELEGTRKTLDFDPISIEGCVHNQIRDAVDRTVEIIESIQVSTPEGLENVKYPPTALHEIITNAVLHRDYSIADDVHVKIFDNRIEVTSPGTLPGHVTPENILRERFARNGVIVRLINKFPNPPNKDVGEGLNTAFSAMRTMNLKDPVVAQDEGSVTITLKHEPLATPEEIIIDFLRKHGRIRNSEAREVCFIGSENQMKRILQKMMNRNLIERVPGTTRFTAAYQLKGAHDSDATNEHQESEGKLRSTSPETSNPRNDKLF
jgi:ATP-dependent DNA helicase RecG